MIVQEFVRPASGGTRPVLHKVGWQKDAARRVRIKRVHGTSVRRAAGNVNTYPTYFLRMFAKIRVLCAMHGKCAQPSNGIRGGSDFGLGSHVSWLGSKDTSFQRVAHEQGLVCAIRLNPMIESRLRLAGGFHDGRRMPSRQSRIGPSQARRYKVSRAQTQRREEGQNVLVPFGLPDHQEKETASKPNKIDSIHFEEMRQTQNAQHKDNKIKAQTPVRHYRAMPSRCIGNGVPPLTSESRNARFALKVKVILN